MNSQQHFPLHLCLLLFLLLLVEECGSKRGGIFTGGRGTSGSRSGGLFGGSHRTSGGLFGSSKSGAAYPGGYSRGGGYYGGVPAGGGGGGWGSRTRGGVGGVGSGWGTSARGSSWGRPRSSGLWHDRPYYWGSNYYRGGYGTHMCRMPVDHNDPQLGNVFFQDGSRPKELVWSCNYNEYCCGYDCCWRGGASSYWGFGLGSILVMLLGLCCVLMICTRLFNTRPNVQRYVPARIQKFVIPSRAPRTYAPGQRE